MEGGGLRARWRELRRPLRCRGYPSPDCPYAVEAGLAHNPEDWPGVTHAATDIGLRTIRTDRPKLYFDPENKRWPESAEIALTVPLELESALGGWEQARARIVKTVKQAVLKAREVAEGRSILEVARRDLCDEAHHEGFLTRGARRAKPYLRCGRNPGASCARSARSENVPRGVSRGEAEGA